MGLLIRRFAAELPSIEAWLDWGYQGEAVLDKRASCARLTAQLQNLYVVTNELRNQRERFTRALAAASRHADREGEANVLKAMGDLLIRVDDLAGARASYEKALPIYRDIEARLGEANVMASMARLALAEGNEAEADQFMEKAIGINQVIGERFNPALDSAKYGIALMEMERREKAKPWLLRAGKGFAEIGFEDYAKACLEMAEENSGQET
jgi:tetratricopeptide (TPR) repeat protein